MVKKYKIKKRKKLISPYVVFAVFAISILFVSTGYALLSDSLSINGTANALAGKYDWGKSTYTYGDNGYWVNTDNMHVYGTQINITNLDDNYTDYIEIAFDVPEGFYYDENYTYNVWQADSITFSDNRLTIVFQNSFSTVALGETITIWPQLSFYNETDVTITDLTLNGKLAKYIP